MAEEATILPQGTPDQPAPVGTDGAGRIESLDFIRGIAVMGILLANISGFGHPMSATVWPGAYLVPDNDPGGWLWVAQFVLVDGKMRGLFTLLFGAGMYLFLERAWQRGAGWGLQLKRLLWLLLFGYFHFLLLWSGDILVLYALCGLLALLFVQLSARNQLVIGLLGYVMGGLLVMGMMGSMYLLGESSLAQQEENRELAAPMQAIKAEDVADGAVETAIMTTGSWWDAVMHRALEHGFDAPLSLMVTVWETVPLMLIGMALYRYGLFSGGIAPRRQLRWGWAALIVGGALSLVVAWWVRSGGYGYFATPFAAVGLSVYPRLAMTVGLAAVLAILAAGRGGWLAGRIRAAGRMAFSNYVGTSLVLLFVFSGWALGLYGRLDRPQLYLLTIGVWVVMLAWSKPWLEHFHYGPLEWAWRCLTYGRFFGLRRAAP